MDTVVTPAAHAAALWSGLLILTLLVLAVLVVVVGCAEWPALAPY